MYASNIGVRGKTAFVIALKGPFGLLTTFAAYEHMTKSTVVI